ncbi:poly(U)-specific 3'-to-5' RNA exonuclease [Saxophila tyrrhenica]|uniref:U6 snRNA phosphodiesterase n=1 Tax=Saxophila tyrrhenica TaxID=1690608 RepID=A0AAV9PJ28_9PEZI|nr:poly(U)-specific 3'-to-5' RNA exonuclease [Saxophila tyrrhenica]
MALVEYSDSEGEDARPATPPQKKRRLTGKGGNELPPLPAAFLDQYSSTVRTSTQDEPSLHGGRKRVTPHVEGNWPTHVYLESTRPEDSKQAKPKPEINSLLQNNLGVSLPLHISLSRPLTLKNAQKESFLAHLQHSITEAGIKALAIIPKGLAWHPNESKTRWFLVIRLQKSPELDKLLATCNSVAKEFKQSLLYVEKGKPKGDKFHISIAWSLNAPRTKDTRRHSEAGTNEEEDMGIPYELIQRLCELDINFSEVKVRVGQDVNVVSLKSKR